MNTYENKVFHRSRRTDHKALWALVFYVIGMKVYILMCSGNFGWSNLCCLATGYYPSFIMGCLSLLKAPLFFKIVSLVALGVGRV